MKINVKFGSIDIEKIGKVLGVEPKMHDNHFRFDLEDREMKRRLTLEIYPELQIGDKIGNLISVYTQSTHIQLHFCSGYVVSEMLGEVTFVSETGEGLSGVIVERGCGSSVYANVDRSILSGDFTKLGPEVMLSGIALSLTEEILTPEEGKKKGKR